jgi:hypothetical protein
MQFANEGGRQHLERCEGCPDCSYLLDLFTACDDCGHWMSKDCEYHYDRGTGATLCGSCEPQEAMA